ncbi:MAG: 50S ribosomal protein L5 [Phycisphaerae bacterium]|nr:50S ribosomal protein L5 [Phycisphaerae bacterium]
MDRLKEKYVKQVVPALKQELGRDNLMAIPRLVKVVISMGLGKAKENKKIMEEAVTHLTVISGQKPLVCRARKSVSNFKLREGNEIGLKVTLRRQRMFEFLDRLISVTIPRVRDFRGLDPKGFDGRGNYNMGLTEQNVFAEIDPDSVETVLGMNISIATTAGDDASARLLLTKLGMPFRTEN